MNIAELKKLAGIDSEQKHEIQQNVSHCNCFKAERKTTRLEAQDREWFKLWFRRPMQGPIYS